MPAYCIPGTLAGASDAVRSGPAAPVSSQPIVCGVSSPHGARTGLGIDPAAEEMPVLKQVFFLMWPSCVLVYGHST